MKIFIIHRFKDKRLAKAQLRQIQDKESLELQPIFLDSSNRFWRQKALNAINQAEAVIIFNKKYCSKSKNANWEIKQAEEAGKKIINIEQNDENLLSIKKLKSLYNLEDEFNKCFSPNNKDYLELYKIMIESSESLIQRRQKTNAFFITIIGSLFSISGILLKLTTVNSQLLNVILLGFSIVSILLCRSWYYLIDNYGKLNKAKFDVILRLEQKFDAQVYLAEWVALGKGNRPEKYKSFTSTEKNVPVYFIILILVICVISSLSL